MKAAAAVVLAAASAVSAAGTVQFDVNKVVPGLRIGTPPPLVRRDTHTQTAINNVTGGGYYVEAKVGNPGQKQLMILDTGSSDAWIVSSEADLCTSARLQQRFGDSCGMTYNPKKSSSYKVVERDGFSITYLDQSTASGDYISDDFTIAGSTIESLQMGLATSTGRGTGILGVGFSANEAAQELYPNIIDQFVSQKLIDTRAYSLWLNDRSAPSGSILFGGIDTEKFIGSLKVVPILQPATGNYTTFAVNLGSLEVAFNKDNSTDIEIPDDFLPAVLDSGTTLSYFPEDIAEDLFSEVGAYTDSVSTGLTLIDCGLLKSQRDLTLTFTFGGGSRSGSGSGSTAKIVVPVEELVLDILGGYEDLLPSNIPFDDVCVFGIQASEDSGSSGGGGNDSDDDDDSPSTTSSYALLGDTVLRSAYVVYHLDSKEIGLAQANLNSPDSRVRELTGGDKGIPTTLSGVAAQQTTFTPSATATATSDSGLRPSITSGSGGESGSPSESGNAAAGGPGSGPGFEALSVVVLTAVFVGFGGVLFSL